MFMVHGHKCLVRPSQLVFVSVISHRNVNMHVRILLMLIKYGFTKWSKINRKYKMSETFLQ